MICDSCKKNDHLLCPNARRELSFGTKRPSTGLSPESEAIQRSGLCPCQHKVPDERQLWVDLIRSGISQECACGARISVSSEKDPTDGQIEFVRLWFKDHSYEDLTVHGKVVFEATQKMRAAAK